MRPHPFDLFTPLRAIDLFLAATTLGLMLALVIVGPRLEIEPPVLRVPPALRAPRPPARREPCPVCDCVRSSFADCNVFCRADGRHHQETCEIVCGGANSPNYRGSR